MDNPWIGIHHLSDDGRTVFASNKTTVAWSNWDAHEPNNEDKRENCTHLYNERNEYSCYFSWIGSGYCSQVNNNEECDWDGGDCCHDVNSNQCLEPNGFEMPQCDWKQMKNGICNDESNTEECKWDGGDCCGDDVVMTECSACECLEPFRWNDDNCDEFRRFICEKEGTGQSH